MEKFRSIYNSPMMTTQKFGNYAPDLYKNYGGRHNGWDVVPVISPSNRPDWRIYSPINGKTIYAGFDKGFGNFVCIHDPINMLAIYLCHFEYLENWVIVSGSVDIKVGDLLGVMGNTGYSKGAHTHIGYVDVDEECMRLNRDNGYNGWVDPKPLFI